MILKYSSKGFTLVELLIVVTLIGILSVAVLSALNPIEQINKTRDAGRKADAAQIIQAIDRYYASNQEFPWNTVSDAAPGLGGLVPSTDGRYVALADANGSGICLNANPPTGDLITTSGAGDTGCEENGPLVTQDELKSQFGKRAYFKTSADPATKYILFKALNDPSVAVCFIPGSKTERKITNGSLKYLTNINAATGDPDAGGAATTINPCFDDGTNGGQYDAAAWDTIAWDSLATAYYLCLPEE